MKTYQFVTIAVLVAAIAAALLYKSMVKKPCGCGGHDDALPLAEGE